MSMSNLPPGHPPSLPPEYGALLERLALPLALERIHRNLTRAFDLDAQHHSDHDEALLRLLLCIRLSPEGAMRAKDISVQLLKSTSHTSRLIDRAVAHDLVERQPDPRDRRAHRVDLTPRGTAEVDAYVPHAVEMLGEAYGRILGLEELGGVLALLGRVEAATLDLVAKQKAAKGD